MPPPISRCGFSSFVPRLPTPSLTRLYSTRITPVLEANNWHTSIDDLGIEKEYKFKTFKAAWSFMNQVAEKAEEKDHHPEWSNVSNATSRDRVLPLTCIGFGMLGAAFSLPIILKIATLFSRLRAARG